MVQASKEFSDPRLKIHILTVLKSMQSKKKASSQSYLDKKSESPFLEENVYMPVKLFRVLADCEKQKNPGEALLLKAKDFSWSILAMIASCFPDVSQLSCLTVWLEITAARLLHLNIKIHFHGLFTLHRHFTLQCQSTSLVSPFVRFCIFLCEYNHLWNYES